MVQYISVGLKLNKKNEAGLKDQYDWKDNYKYRGHHDRRHPDRRRRELRGDKEATNGANNNIDINVNNNEQGEYDFFAFIAGNTKSFGNNHSNRGRTPPRAGKLLRRVDNLPLSLNEYMQKNKGCWVCYGKGNAHQHDHTKCAVYAADKMEYLKLHPERVPKEKRMQNGKDRQSCQDGGGQSKDQHVRKIWDVAEYLLQAGGAAPTSARAIIVTW